jgi:hypothetical protein
MQYLVCTKNSAYGVASFLEKEEVLKAFQRVCEVDPVHHGHLVYRTEGGNKNVVFGNSNQSAKKLRFFKAVLTDGVNHWLVQAYDDHSREVPDAGCWFYNPSPTGILLGMGKAGFTFAAWNVTVGVDALPDLNTIEKVDPQRWTEVIMSGIKKDDSTVADAPEKGKKAKNKKENKKQKPEQVIEEAQPASEEPTIPEDVAQLITEPAEELANGALQAAADAIPKPSDDSVAGLMEVN